MAPEQIRGLGASTRSDLYAAGVVLYEMLAGQVPFSGNSTVEVLASVLCDPMPSLSDLRPSLPTSLVRVVAEATSRDAEHAFPVHGPWGLP